MEEGTSKITITDGLTLVSAQSANFVLDSIDKDGGSVAEDRFRGANHLLRRQFHGENVQFFKPNNLTLFELVVLADTAHTLHPNYSIMGTQCYFYAGLVYTAAMVHGGMKPVDDADGGETVYICGSYLSDKYGRWKGLKVTKVDPGSDSVKELIARFKVELRSEMSNVTIIIQYWYHSLLTTHSSQIQKTHRSQQKMKSITAIVQQVLFYFILFIPPILHMPTAVVDLFGAASSSLPPPVVCKKKL